MKTSIYSRYRFHPNIIKRAVWLYFRFNLSFRDVEGLVIKSSSESPSPVWYLDEVYTKINGRMFTRPNTEKRTIRRRERKSERFRSI